MNFNLTKSLAMFDHEFRVMVVVCACILSLHAQNYSLQRRATQGVGLLVSVFSLGREREIEGEKEGKGGGERGKGGGERQTDRRGF